MSKSITIPTFTIPSFTVTGSNWKELFEHFIWLVLLTVGGLAGTTDLGTPVINAITNNPSLTPTLVSILSVVVVAGLALCRNLVVLSGIINRLGIGQGTTANNTATNDDAVIIDSDITVV